MGRLGVARVTVVIQFRLRQVVARINLIERLLRDGNSATFL
jgi:hypothetical protein